MRLTIARLLLASLGFVLPWMMATTTRGDDAGAEPTTGPDYNSQVAPVFQKYCNACHGGGEAEGGLILDDHQRLLAGGKRGPAIVPGQADQSRLLLVLEGKAKPAMPPEGNEPPTADEIAILRAWIDAGAAGPTGEPPDPTRLLTPEIPLLTAARLPISALASSPDGSLIALAGYGTVRLVSPQSGQIVRELAGHRGNVNSVTFSADGTRLVAACGEPGLFGEARVWTVADGVPERTIVAHRDSLYAALLSPDGTLLATAGYDEQIKLWNAATGEEIRTIAGHNGAVYDLAFRPDGRVLASASADRTVKLWDVATGERLDTLGQSLKELYTLAFSPDGRQLAAAGVDNRIRVWQISGDAKEGTNPLRYARFAHQGAVIKIAWSADGRWLASSSEDRTLKLWDAGPMRETRLLEAQPDWTNALAFAPDGGRLFVGRLDGTFAQYDVNSGNSVPLPKPGDGASSLPHGPATLPPVWAWPSLLGYADGDAAQAPAAPQLTGLAPRGVQRGVPTRIKLSGANLSSVSELKLGDPRLTATIVPQAEGQAGEVFIDVAPTADVPRGGYDVAVVTPGGMSAALKLYVDDLPQAVESEPNETFQTANAALLGSGIWGVLDRPGDVDTYAIDAQAGQTIVFDVAAAAIGSKANAVVTLYDAAGRVVAANNDFDGQPDPLLAFAVPANGRYAAVVTDLALGASAEHFYRLSIGDFRYVTGCFPLSVPAGQVSHVELTGYNLPPDARVTVQAGPGGDVPVPVDPERFRARRALSVLAGTLPEALEAEPNDTPTSATRMSAPGVAGGRLYATAGEDVDLFRFSSTAGRSWVVEIDAARRGSPVDSRIEVLDTAGQPVQRMLLQAVRDSYITFRPIDSNIPDARLQNWEEMSLNQFLYMQGEVCKLFRAPQGPDSGFNFYAWNGKRICYFDTSPTVHALDEPAYIVEPHPPGTDLVPTGLPVFPLYFANDDDGERKLGSDSKLMFTAPAEGDYLVRVSDVRGQGGDRFAYRLIVRDPAPAFSVSLAGANPTVAAGSGQELVLNAERFDGFDGPITVEIAGLPPGFSVSSPVVIEAGHIQAKAVLSVAADAPAPTDENATASTIKATAEIAGAAVSKDVNNLGRIALGAKPTLLVRLEPDPSAVNSAGEIVMAPGTTVPAWLRVERNGFADRISFDVGNLPHGVIVDDIGLNGVLIPENQTERRIFLSAAPWVSDTSRQIHAVARAGGNQASAPVIFRVQRPADLAGGGQ
jgi:WD40 repeat protein